MHLQRYVYSHLLKNVIVTPQDRSVSVSPMGRSCRLDVNLLTRFCEGRRSARAWGDQRGYKTFNGRRAKSTYLTDVKSHTAGHRLFQGSKATSNMRRNGSTYLGHPTGGKYAWVVSANLGIYAFTFITVTVASLLCFFWHLYLRTIHNHNVICQSAFKSYWFQC